MTVSHERIEISSINKRHKISKFFPLEGSHSKGSGVNKNLVKRDSLHYRIILKKNPCCS